MRVLAVSLFILFGPVCATEAEPLLCPDTEISVDAPHSELAGRICHAVGRALQVMRSCDFPPLTTPLRIDVTDNLPPGCTGVFHCGEGKIEVLHPSAMETRRDPDGAFSALASDLYLDSVIAHELAHAVFGNVPCPFAACTVTDEYLAYGVQFLSLPGEARQTVKSTADVTGRVSRDELSQVLLLMAPHRFARQAWTHLEQQEDPCGFLKSIVEGTVVLDRERFHP